jgi:uncharacterized damage-inducible protein DinB/GNAT superfamily N-acetyltransferase
MQIRKATPADAAAISAIAESLRYKAGVAIPSKGFLVFVGTPAEYASRLEGNDTSFVAELDGEVLAFLLTASNPGNTATHTDADEVILRTFDGNALLVDQIGVSARAKGQGSAALLLDAVKTQVKPHRMTASIMHGPLRNERSIGFFSGKNGFHCIGEYHEGHGFLWGIYEWNADGSQGDPRYPLGRYLYTGPANETDFAERIERLRVLPERLRAVASQLTDDALDIAPRPGAWTARQVIHHIADAHQVLAGRVRLILTEEQPPVKTFDENTWAELADAKTAPIEESMRILDGLHARLVRLLVSRPYEDLSREMLHPDQGLVKLDRLLSYLDWHGRHHTAQVHSMAR